MPHTVEVPLIWVSLLLLVISIIGITIRVKHDTVNSPSAATCQSYLTPAGGCGIWKGGKCWAGHVQVQNGVAACYKSKDDVAMGLSVVGGIGIVGLVVALIMHLSHK